MQDFKPDLTTSTASKMLLAIFVMLKIEPSLSGLIKATGNDPEVIFKAIGEAADKAPHIMANVETLMLLLRESADRQVRIEAKLDVLLSDAGYEHGDAAISNALHRARLIAPHDAQLVTQAALDEASGRS